MTGKLNNLQKSHGWPALGLVLALLLIGSLVITPAAAQPSLPSHQFWGYAYIGGSPAPEGTSVVAQVGGVTYATTTVDSSGRYGWSPAFYVEGAAPGSTVNFLLGGTQAPQTAVWETGGYDRLDLYVTSGGGTPAVSTSAAGSITSTTATLNGNLTNMGGAASVDVYFQYGTTALYGSTTSSQSKTATGAFSAGISGLAASTTYHFRAVAVGGTTVYGSDLTFTTSAAALAVSTNAATGVTTASATLNGNLTSLGGAGTVYVHFEHGTTASYGSSTSTQSKTATGTFSAGISGLASGTTYHCRAVAVGASTVYGSDTTFTTTNGGTPSTPSHQFWGRAYINGTLASAGNTVAAYVNGVSAASTTTDSSGRYGWSPVFYVPGSGGTVTFYVNGHAAPQSATWTAGGITNLDLYVTIPGPAIAYTPSTLDFGSIQVGSNPADQTLEIWNGGTETINWSAADDVGWLSLSPTSGSSTGEHDSVTVSVDTSGMSAGSYSATITITAAEASNSPQTVPVSLVLVDPTDPLIGFDPSSFTFTATEGGSNPATQPLEIWNSGVDTLNWSAADDAAWLSLSPTSGSSTGEHDSVTLSVDITGLTAAGSPYTATITISDSGAANTPQTVPVSLTVSPPVAGKLIGADDVDCEGGYAGGYFLLFRFRAERTGTINTFRVKAWESGNVKVAIYDDSSGEPGDLLGAVDATAVTAGQWNDITTTDPKPSVVAGNYYWLAFISDTRVVCLNTSLPAVPMRFKHVPYSGFSFPDPAGEGFTPTTIWACGLIAGY